MATAAMIHHRQTNLNDGNTARNQLVMLSRHEVPRTYAHQVVKRKLKHQSTFCYYLSCTMQRCAYKRTNASGA